MNPCSKITPLRTAGPIAPSSGRMALALPPVVLKGSPSKWYRYTPIQICFMCSPSTNRLEIKTMSKLDDSSFIDYLGNSLFSNYMYLRTENTTRMRNQKQPKMQRMQKSCAEGPPRERGISSPKSRVFRNMESRQTG